MQQYNSSSTAYDDAYRTMLEKCSSLVLPVINELFGEDYCGDEEVVLNQNELFITTPDEKSVERITDSSMQVVTADRKSRYHIECQSTPDQSILIRTSDGQSIRHRIPVMKLNCYGLDELCSSGQMDGYQKYRIIFSINMVLQKLMEKYPDTRKEVLDVMGGKVVECEVDWILQRGIEQGRSQMIENLLNRNKTPAEIAEFCGFEIQEIENVQKKMLVNI